MKLVKLFVTFGGAGVNGQIHGASGDARNVGRRSQVGAPSAVVLKHDAVEDVLRRQRGHLENVTDLLTVTGDDRQMWSDVQPGDLLFSLVFHVTSTIPIRQAGLAARSGAPPCDNPRMLIGAHVSCRGGIHTAVDRAAAIGADLFQTHPTPAQMWRPLRLDPEVRKQYLTSYAAAGMRGHYMHAVYLINLATPKDQLLRQSIGSLVHYMQLAEQLNADGVIFHPGSHLGAGFDGMLEQMGTALREVLERAPDSPAKLVVENSAGSGGCVGCSFEELGRIVDAAGSDRVGVCLDTQHMFASGYDVRTAEQVATTLDRFDTDVGFERLALVHANDSRRPLGSNVDRHANIGEGEMGTEAFTLLLADDRLRGVPWILEVPGEDRSGPDLANINRLRECAGLAPRVLEPAAAG